MNRLLGFFYFFYFAVVGIYVIFLPKVLAMSGYTASQIGIIFTAAPIVRFLLPFAFVRGLKLSSSTFNVALIIMLGSVVCFYFSLNNFYQLFFANIGLGIGTSLILPYIEVISLDILGKEKYGKVRLYGSVGFISVALVLVKFLSSADVALVFLVSLVFITAFFAFLIAKNANLHESGKLIVSGQDGFLNDYALWIGLTLMQLSFGAFYNFFTIYETDFGVSLDMTIYLWSFGVFAEIFMLFFQGSFLKQNLLIILQISTFIAAIRWFLVFLFPQNIAVLFFAQSMHAISFALFHSAAISYLYSRYTNKKLASQFFSGITYGLGGLFGALLSGYIYEYYPSYLFLSSSFLALLACGFIYFYAKKSIAER